MRAHSHIGILDLKVHVHALPAFLGSGYPPVRLVERRSEHVATRGREESKAKLAAEELLQQGLCSPWEDFLLALVFRQHLLCPLLVLIELICLVR